MKLFLKLKHWHLFLAYCSPFIAQFFQPLMAGSGEHNFLIVLILFIVSAITLFGWIWAVTMRLRPFSRRQSLPFQVAYWLTVTYFVVCAAMIASDRIQFQIIIIPHIIAMVAIFYCLFFAAKRLKTIEKGSSADATEHFSVFFLMMFFPFGIWFLQPKVNKLYFGN